ncbi:hypothetical protein BX666DRAFT_1135508 [Dichotomocladium elegans]|nr:hypothetical protein BX666DRAFT_1135508 [Dichotomocladium elegans]
MTPVLSKQMIIATRRVLLLLSAIIVAGVAAASRMSEHYLTCRPTQTAKSLVIYLLTTKTTTMGLMTAAKEAESSKTHGYPIRIWWMTNTVYHRSSTIRPSTADTWAVTSGPSRPANISARDRFHSIRLRTCG